HLLNSKEIQERLTADDGRPASLANDTKTSNPLKLRQLYMLAFSREPSTNEIQFAQSYLDKKGDQQKKTAYEDIVWAVLNTKEFLFNH
ncbi:MAG: S-layer protein, partial [Verrucomicrobia bacterium]|nr:S-layer protein [Verrucomicrobiota bacterium]